MVSRMKKGIRFVVLLVFLFVLSIGYRILGTKKKLDHGSATIIDSVSEVNADVGGPGPSDGGPVPGADDS